MAQLMNHYLANKSDYAPAKTNGQEDDHAIDVFQFERKPFVLFKMRPLHVSASQALLCVRGMFLQLCIDEACFPCTLDYLIGIL